MPHQLAVVGSSNQWRAVGAMTELVKWTIPADFISERVALTASEVAYGLRLEWLTFDDGLRLVSQSPATLASRSAPSAGPLEARDPTREEALIRVLEGQQTGDEQRVWLFLGLAWLLENRSTYEEPLKMIDRISEDFGHLKLIRHLIYWMPPEGGHPVGVRGLERWWLELVDKLSQEFGARGVVAR